MVDDDKAVRESLRRSLEFNGYDVSVASDGAEALAGLAAAGAAAAPDVVVMDVMMPRLDGIETTRALRAAGNDVPILVLTARDAVGDRVEGLDAGADDYLTKPFALQELLARLRALLRRATVAPGEADEVLAFSDLSMELATREVRRGDRTIVLTRTEFTLLEMFLRRPRRVLERSFILEEVWGYDFPTTANSLEVYVGYLRRKTEAEDEPRLIHTVRGVGYVLKETVTGPLPFPGEGRWHYRRSLASRVTLLTTMAVGLSVAIVALGAYATVRMQLQSSLDDSLVTRARIAAARRSTRSPRLRGAGVPARCVRRPRRLHAVRRQVELHGRRRRDPARRPRDPRWPAATRSRACAPYGPAASTTAWSPYQSTA